MTQSEIVIAFILKSKEARENYLKNPEDKKLEAEFVRRNDALVMLAEVLEEKGQ